MSEKLTYKIFAEHLNTKFNLIFYEGEVVELELIEAVDKETDVLECFILLFQGPMDRPLPQKIHKMQHHKLGDISFFIVPVGKTKSALLYEAVFNRLKEE